MVSIDLGSPELTFLCQKDKRLAKLIRMIGPLTYSLHDDDYSFLIREIIEQMMSVKAARAIYARLEALCCGSVTPESITKLTDEEIRSVGISWAKIGYIRNVTMMVQTGKLDFDSLKSMTDREIIKLLTSVRGIGTWTAKMYLMFVLGRPDVLPYEDGAFCQTYRWLYKTDDTSPASMMKKCKKWKPYTSTAARYFYRALDCGLTKSEFHLFK